MKLNINKQQHDVTADPRTPLLYVLRGDLKLNAAKFGCGLGQCGPARYWSMASRCSHA